MAIPVPDPLGPVAGAVTGAAGAAVGAVTGAAGAAIKQLPGASELGAVADGVAAVRAWITNRHNWTRVAWFASGSVMFTVGALMLGERPIANATTAVVKPVGRVVKSAYKG